MECKSILSGFLWVSAFPPVPQKIYWIFVKKQVGFFSHDFGWNLLYPVSKHMIDRNGYDKSDIQFLQKKFLFLDAWVSH
jgi:hypothetical protein